MSNEQEWSEWKDNSDGPYQYRRVDDRHEIRCLTATYANRLEALAALADEEWGGLHRTANQNGTPICRSCRSLLGRHEKTCRKARYDAIKAEQEG